MMIYKRNYYYITRGWKRDWRTGECLEDAGLKVSRSKTEHLPPRNNDKKIKLQAQASEDKTELPTISALPGNNYYRQRTGFCKRIEKAWNRWRDLTGIFCDKRIPTKLRVLLYKTAIGQR